MCALKLCSFREHNFITVRFQSYCNGETVLYRFLAPTYSKVQVADVEFLFQERLTCTHLYKLINIARARPAFRTQRLGNYILYRGAVIRRNVLSLCWCFPGTSVGSGSRERRYYVNHRNLLWLEFTAGTNSWYFVPGPSAARRTRQQDTWPQVRF